MISYSSLLLSLALLVSWPTLNNLVFKPAAKSGRACKLPCHTQNYAKSILHRSPDLATGPLFVRTIRRMWRCSRSQKRLLYPPTWMCWEALCLFTWCSPGHSLSCTCSSSLLRKKKKKSKKEWKWWAFKELYIGKMIQSVSVCITLHMCGLFLLFENNVILYTYRISYLLGNCQKIIWWDECYTWKNGLKMFHLYFHPASVEGLVLGHWLRHTRIQITIINLIHRSIVVREFRPHDFST